MKMRVLAAILALALLLTLIPALGEGTALGYRFADADEAAELLLSHRTYYENMNQMDIDFRLQRKGGTLEELDAFAAEQTRDFTDKEKGLLDGYLADMATMLAERGYTLPPLDEVTFVKTTMAEAYGAAGYTHGTTVFLSADLLDSFVATGEFEGDPDLLRLTIWHELFHCLTRCNPDFRVDMYKLIHFTVHDADYTLPPSVAEYHISNPDVEHHNSSATFKIGGKEVECFTDWVTTRHFEKEGDNFFEYAVTALVPVDGTDAYYTSDQATNFNEVFGSNTEYVTDPEECLAENFALLMTYGTKGPDGNGYPSPEIIEGIVAYLSK